MKRTIDNAFRLRPKYKDLLWTMPISFANSGDEAPRTRPNPSAMIGFKLPATKKLSQAAKQQAAETDDIATGTLFNMYSPDI
jgi:hypothetical protein